MLLISLQTLPSRALTGAGVFLPSASKKSFSVKFVGMRLKVELGRNASIKRLTELWPVEIAVSRPITGRLLLFAGDLRTEQSHCPFLGEARPLFFCSPPSEVQRGACFFINFYLRGAPAKPTRLARHDLRRR